MTLLRVMRILTSLLVLITIGSHCASSAGTERKFISFSNPPIRSSSSSSLSSISIPTKLISPTTSPIINKIIISTTLTFLLQSLNPAITPLFMRSSSALRATPLRSSYRLLTPIFLHASLPHLAVNMYSLYNIGPATSKTFGKSFLPLYLISGIGGNIFSTVLTRSLHAPGGVGASGAVIGLCAAFYVRAAASHTTHTASRVDPTLRSLRRTAALNLMIGITSPGVDNKAHIGGAMTGAVAAWYMEGRRRKFTVRDYMTNVNEQMQLQKLRAAAFAKRVF